MKKINNKGFTLVELIAIVVLLALVMGIGAVSVTKIMNNAKEEDYKLLMDNIKGGVELYYQECTYAKTDSISCPSLTSGWYYIYLEDLVTYGFVKGNATHSNGKMYLANTKNGENINRCIIRYKYNSGKLEIQKYSGGSNCPTMNDYAS